MHPLVVRNLTRFAALTALFAAAAPATAQQDVFAGKTITIVVSYAPGGGYDLYSRLLSRHFGNHVPGKPTVVVQNMPGAAGIVASNHVYNAAPKDGTVIAAVDQNIPLLQLLGGEGLRFDVAKFKWLGILASSNGLVMSWATSGIKSIEDAKSSPVPMGATGSNDDAWVYAKTLNATIGTKFNLITGYQGTSAVNVAIERGEVAAMARSSYFGFQAQKPDWLRDRKVQMLVQLGFTRQPELPDVPLLIDLMKTDEHKAIARLVTLPTAIGYSHWLAPEVPADRAAALRKAYVDTVKDEAFLAEAAKLNLVIRPKTAAEIEGLIAQATATPEATRKRAAAILEWK